MPRLIDFMSPMCQFTETWLKPTNLLETICQAPAQVVKKISDFLVWERWDLPPKGSITLSHSPSGKQTLIQDHLGEIPLPSVALFDFCGSMVRGLKAPQPWTCCPHSQLWLRSPGKLDLHCRNAWMSQPCSHPVVKPGIAQPGALTCQLLPLLSIPKALGANPPRLFQLGTSFFPLLKVRSCVNCQETPSPEALGLLKFTLTPEQLPKPHLESFTRAKIPRGEQLTWHSWGIYW